MFALALTPMRSCTIKSACMSTLQNILYRLTLVCYRILQDCTIFSPTSLDLCGPDLTADKTQCV